MLGLPGRCATAVREQSRDRVVPFFSSHEIRHRIVEVGGIDVEFPGNVGDGVGAGDVEGEGAASGEVARFNFNAAEVIEEGDIADVVAAVFQAPVPAERLTGVGRRQADQAGIDGCLVGIGPD